MMNEVVDEYWLTNECIISDFDVIISYVYLCVPMASVQMTAMTQGNYTEALLHTEAFTHTGTFTQRSFYTQRRLHASQA